LPASLNTEFGLHYAVFGAVKFVGYSTFAVYLKKLYHDSDADPLLRGEAHPLLVGAVRTCIGMAVGLAYASLAGGLLFGEVEHHWVYYSGLAPIRVVEWSFLVWLFYDRSFSDRRRLLKTIIFGTIVSYILDLPASLGYLMTGGLCVCYNGQ
jgi:hypothetical protein